MSTSVTFTAPFHFDRPQWTIDDVPAPSLGSDIEVDGYFYRVTDVRPSYHSGADFFGVFVGLALLDDEGDLVEHDQTAYEAVRPPPAPRVVQEETARKPHLTLDAPVGSVDLEAFGYEITACHSCLPWRVEVVRDIVDPERIIAREWHAMDCPELQEMLVANNG